MSSHKGLAERGLLLPAASAVCQRGAKCENVHAAMSVGQRAAAAG